MAKLVCNGKVIGTTYDEILQGDVVMFKNQGSVIEEALQGCRSFCVEGVVRKLVDSGCVYGSGGVQGYRVEENEIHLVPNEADKPAPKNPDVEPPVGWNESFE